MTNAEFQAKLNALPAEGPDEIDIAMMEEAEAVNDGTTVSLEELQQELDAYSGRIVLRMAQPAVSFTQPTHR